MLRDVTGFWFSYRNYERMIKMGGISIMNAVEVFSENRAEIKFNMK